MNKRRNDDDGALFGLMNVALAALLWFYIFCLFYDALPH